MSGFSAEPTHRIVLASSGTPSLFSNNLSASESQLVFVSAQSIHSVPTTAVHTASSDARGSAVPQKDLDEICQVKMVTVGGVTRAVACCEEAKVFNQDFSRLLRVVAPSSLRVTPESRSRFFRGVTALTASNGTGLFCIGSSTGQVAVAEGDVNTPFILDVSSSPITELSSCGSLLVVGDDSGTVSVFQADSPSSFTLKGTVANTAAEPIPVSSLVCFHNMAFVGYGHGVIRLLDLQNLSEIAEISAHSRWINGLALHPSKPLVASVAEDCVINVWRLPSSPEEAPSQLNLVASLAVPDNLLTGVAWVEDSIVASAYEIPSLVVFTPTGAL